MQIQHGGQIQPALPRRDIREVICLNEIRLEGELIQSRALDVQCPDRLGSIRCMLHPARPIESIAQSEEQVINDATDVPASDLIAPISIPNQKLKISNRVFGASCRAPNARAARRGSWAGWRTKRCAVGASLVKKTLTFFCCRSRLSLG